MSVALELRAPADGGRRLGRRSSPTGQTGMMIEGWGVAVDRLISDFAQGTVEWLVEQGEARGRLGHRRGPGLARPPGLLVGDAGADPRRDAARDGHGPQAGARPTTTSTTCPRRPFPIAPLPPFIALHEQVAGLVAPSKVVGRRAQHVALSATTTRHAGVIDEIAAETGLPADDPVRFGGGPAVAGDPRARSTPCRGSLGVTLSVTPRGPAPRPSATRSGSPAPTIASATA